ncbi:SAV_915 family protein [Rhodococcus sp. NPDC058514]|uniref:SAV_915 family protein n=1 Tax=unclassified Rhodococcus (in: high G+C Gram-positive bacteria) TaxID=192944 RepID=UPI00365CCDA4
MVEHTHFGADVLFVPTRPHDASGRVQLELRTLPDGRVALPVYTSIPSLVRCCGPHQHWGALGGSGFDQVKAATGFDVALVDARIPDAHRRQQPEPGQADDEALPDSWLESASVWGAGDLR